MASRNSPSARVRISIGGDLGLWICITVLILLVAKGCFEVELW